MDDEDEFEQIDSDAVEPRRKHAAAMQPPWPRCEDCELGFDALNADCATCRGIGYISVPLDDAAFNATRRGSRARQVMIRARYVAGLDPLCPAAEQTVPDFDQPLLTPATDT